MQREVGYIDIHLVEKIASEIHSLKPKRMNLHLFGESILHSRLRDILVCLKTASPETWLSFSTNAHYLTIPFFKRTLGLLDNLFISIDGITQATYSSYRTRGDFEQVTRNVEEVLSFRKQNHLTVPRIEIRMISLYQNEKEKTTFLNLWRDKILPCDSLSLKNPSSFGGNVKPLNRLKIKRCAFLYNGVSIFWNGDLTTCCFDCHGKNVLGNVYMNSITEIFNSQAFNHLRELYETHRIREDERLLCYSCLADDYWCSMTSLHSGPGHEQCGRNDRG